MADAPDPLALLIEVLAASIELLSLEENDFSWSSWRGRDDAIRELERYVDLAKRGIVPDLGQLAAIYAPTGPMQEVSLSSGWADAFTRVAERFDLAQRLLAR